MALTSGVRLGVYQITTLIGEGGMGQVYRARDSRLNRHVALKVLPDSFAGDPDRLARFTREAQTLAALNHPNIAAIYGLEESAATSAGQAGVRALVMELVEGEDLSQRIARGAIPIDEVLPIAKQIAAALEAAHEQGVIHRDLKPANIKVRADGTVKVLDFGLAKALDPAPASSAEAMNSPTLSLHATQAGMILGTAAYMAPEQAKGRTVDRRADIWAFGVVLYEMLTGRRAFAGEDITDTLAAVVLREPDWSALPAETPPGLQRLLTRCLRKDPKQRLHHIADARIELDEPATAVASSIARTPVVALSRWWLAAGAIVVLALVGVALAQTIRLSRAVSAPSGPVRFAIAPPSGVEISGMVSSLAAISPDGSRLVQSLRRGPVFQLFVRRLDEDEAKPMAGTEDGSRPFFSPDGKWIGFAVRDTLKKVAVDGGAAVDIARSDFGTGAWAPDDTIVFTPNYTAGLWRVAASGGTPQKLTEPNTADGELGHFWPQILPDGKTVLFTSFRTPAERSRIEVYSLDTGARKVVFDGAFYGRYALSGHLLFARSTTVFAVPFDVDRQEAVGSPSPVVADVAVDLPNGLAGFSVSLGGTLAYVAQSAVNPPRRLVWVDRTGRVSPASDARRRFEDPALSPDGRRLALTIRDEQGADVWVYDFARGTFGRVTSSPTTQSDPVWTPDGRRLLFLFEEPVFHLYSRLADGGPEPERILDGPFDLTPRSVSPDGATLVYERSDPSTRGGIWLLPLSGDRKPRAFVDTPASERNGAVSPDGHWLAYRSDETGRDEVYLQSFPDGSERVQVSTNGGLEAKWSRDGKEIYFREGDKLMAASVRGREVGRPVMLFEMAWSGYDAAPDGRFIAILPDEKTPPAPVHIVLNWFEELKRLAPVK